MLSNIDDDAGHCGNLQGIGHHGLVSACLPACLF